MNNHSALVSTANQLSNATEALVEFVDKRL